MPCFLLFYFVLLQWRQRSNNVHYSNLFCQLGIQYADGIVLYKL